MFENLKNWKTSLIGFITIIISILVAFGVIDQGDQGTAAELSTKIVEAIAIIITAASGFIAIFNAKDKPKA